MLLGCHTSFEGSLFYKYVPIILPIHVFEDNDGAKGAKDTLLALSSTRNVSMSWPSLVRDPTKGCQVKVWTLGTQRTFALSSPTNSIFSPKTSQKFVKM